jgi:hypothetical protein
MPTRKPSTPKRKPRAAGHKPAPRPSKAGAGAKTQTVRAVTKPARRSKPASARLPRPEKKAQPIRIKLKLPKPIVLPWRESLPRETLIGIAEDYLDHHRVMLTTLLDELALGEHLHIRGRTTDLTQTVTSLQVNHLPVNLGQIGQEVGIQVDQKVRKHDYIYRILPEA